MGCYVFQCHSRRELKYQNEEKIHFFRPKNKNQLAEWSKIIGRENITLTLKTHVCHKHFRDEFVVRDFKHIINGKDHSIPRDKWLLKENAIPELCISSDPRKKKTEVSDVSVGYPLKQLHQCENSKKRTVELSTTGLSPHKKKSPNNLNRFTNAKRNLSNPLNQASINYTQDLNIQPDFSTLKDNVEETLKYKVEETWETLGKSQVISVPDDPKVERNLSNILEQVHLPSPNWIFLRDSVTSESGSFILNTKLENGAWFPIKQVVADANSIKVFIMCQQLPEEFVSVPVIKSVEGLSQYLKHLNDSTICCGIEHFKKAVNVFTLRTFSEKCSLIIKPYENPKCKLRCANCQKKRDFLANSSHRKAHFFCKKPRLSIKGVITPDQVKVLQKERYRIKRKVLNLKRKVKSSSDQIETLRNEIAHAEKNCLQGLEEKQKLAFLACIENAKKKPNGYLYLPTLL